MAARKKKPKVIKLPLPPKPKPLADVARETHDQGQAAAAVFDPAVDKVKASLADTLKYLGGLLVEVRDEELVRVQALIQGLTEASHELEQAHETVSLALEATDGFACSVDYHFGELQEAAKFLEHIADPYQRNPFAALERDQAALHVADIVLGETG